jgi:aspartate carbamoyltransferase regulatory subunit
MTRKVAVAPARENPGDAEASLKRDRKLQVRTLESGTVIDHLNPGTALRTLHLLALDHDATVLVGSNLKSGKHRKKDLIKVEGRELTQRESDKVALLSPQATLNIIRDYGVVKKIKPKIPDQIEGLIRCVNPSCITQDSRVPSRFRTESREPPKLRCFYCERTFAQEDIDFLVATE